MGHGAELQGKEKVLHDNYGYNEQGIEALLNEYYSIKEMGFYSYDSSAVGLCLDFEKALSSTLLTEDQRESIALVYAMQLTYVQASKLLKKKVSEVKELCDDAKEVLEAVLKGFKSTFKEPSESKATTISQWIQEIRKGETMIYDIPGKVNTAFLQYLNNNRDRLAKETLRQRVEGRPLEGENGWNDIMGRIPYDKKRYPDHQTSVVIESPTRKHDYKNGKKDGADYFHDQDRHNGVIHDDFSNTAKGLKATGKKKTKVSDDSSSNKGVMFE